MINTPAIIFTKGATMPSEKQSQVLITRDDLLPVSETNFSYLCGGKRLYRSATPEMMYDQAIFALSIAVYLKDQAAEKANQVG